MSSNEPIEPIISAAQILITACLYMQQSWLYVKHRFFGEFGVHFLHSIPKISGMPHSPSQKMVVKCTPANTHV